MLATFVLAALMGLTIANPLDLQAREDVKEDNFDLCRLLGCHRPPTVTRTLIYTITLTSISSATATATVTTTVDCSSSATAHETTTSDFTSTEITATTATSTDTTASTDTTSTDSVTLPETTALTTTIASTDSTTSTDTTSAEITVAPTTLTNTTSTGISSSAGVTSSTNVTIPTDTTSTDVTTSTDITIPTNTTTSTAIAIPTNTTPANMTISINTTASTGTTSASGITVPTDIATDTTATAAETTETTTSAATPTTAARTSSTTGRLSPQSTPAPFNCSADAYFIQDRTLLRVNLQTGAKTTLSSRLGGSSAKVNAIGFNTFDNFIYGLQGRTVVRVGSDGTLQTVLRGHMAANAGDIDADGQFYYSAGGRAWGRVDLKPGSPRFGQLVARGMSDSSTLPRGLVVADWAFTPAAPGYLHSVAVDANSVVYLVRWDVDMHMWEVRHKGLPSFGIRGSAFGAVVATSDGVLYASHNRSGAVLRIPLDNPEGTTEVKVLVPRAGFSDGCRCASKPDAAV